MKNRPREPKSAESAEPPKSAEAIGHQWAHSVAGKTLATERDPCRVAPLQSSTAFLLPAYNCLPATYSGTNLSVGTLQFML